MLLPKIVRMFTSWFDDHIYLRLLKNASWLTGATFIAGLLGLGSITLTARTLGAADFGIFAMIMTYAAIVDRLLNFQSWQFLIKNGADALAQTNHNRFCRQVKFSALLDVISSILSTLIAISFAGIMGKLIGWSEHEINLTMIYSLTILFHLSGMPTGVLRLFNQFQTLATQKILMAISNLLGVSMAWLLNGELLQFLLAFALSNIVGNLYLFIMGWSQLNHQKIVNVHSTPLAGLQKSEPGVWRFVIYTNIESSVKIIRDLDIFLIKVFLSSETVGLYALARKIAEALHMMIDSFFHAIYPELSRMIAMRNLAALQRLVKRSSLSVGSVATTLWIVFLVLGPWIIITVFGTSFTQTYTLAAICMLGNVIWAFSQPIAPILYNLGKARDVFRITVTTMTLYILTLIALVAEFGVIGASMAYTGYFLTWTIITIIVTKYRLNTHKWKSE